MAYSIYMVRRSSRLFCNIPAAALQVISLGSLLGTQSFIRTAGYSVGLATTFHAANRRFTLLGLVFSFNAQSLLLM